MIYWYYYNILLWHYPLRFKAIKKKYASIILKILKSTVFLRLTLSMSPDKKLSARWVPSDKTSLHQWTQ
jgi:hypothetical protein